MNLSPLANNSMQLSLDWYREKLEEVVKEVEMDVVVVVGEQGQCVGVLLVERWV